jgi:hypothetical protein
MGDNDHEQVFAANGYLKRFKVFNFPVVQFVKKLSHIRDGD